MKFKHGDRVKCTIKGTEIDDARISINKDGTPFICQDKKDGWDAEDKLGYQYSWQLNDDFTYDDFTNLRHAEKSFDYPEIGDKYTSGLGNSRFVLGVAGRAIFLSSVNDKDSFGYGTTKVELVERGYTIANDEPKEEPTEMTLEEIQKLVGKKVKIVDKK